MLKSLSKIDLKLHLRNVLKEFLIWTQYSTVQRDEQLALSKIKMHFLLILNFKVIKRIPNLDLKGGSNGCPIKGGVGAPFFLK